MTGKQVLSEISRYAPCPHNNVDTNLGNGEVWAKCEDCGALFQQENWQKARAASQKFDEAVSILRNLIDNSTSY